jgi:hypothetical protein
MYPRHLVIWTALAACALAATGSGEEPEWAARWLPLDGDGWSVLRPSADSRLIYVSADGNDAEATPHVLTDQAVGVDPTRPKGPVKAFATIEAAMAAARDGEPDWVLFRRGDTWTGHIPAPPSGHGPKEPFVLGSWGEGKRPVIRSADKRAIVFNRAGCRDIVLTGLDFYSHTRDPNSPDYAGITGMGGLQVFLKGKKTTERVLIEDCRVRWASYAVTLEAAEGAVIRQVVVRRCVIVDAHGARKAQGLWSARSSFLLEENVFDHNGWSRQAENPRRLGKLGEANMLNHNTYVSGTYGTTFRGNLFLRPSSMQNKFTANDGEHSAGPIRVEENFYVDGELGISLGGNRAGPLRWKDIRVTRNVLVDVGRSRPTNRNLAWYIGIQDWDGGEVTGNLLVGTRVPEVVSAYGIAIRGPAGHAHTRNVTVRENVVYGLRGGLAGLIITEGQRLGRVRIEGNQWQFPGLETTVASVASDLKGVRFARNVYWSGLPEEKWFAVGKHGQSYIQWINPSARNEWLRFEQERMGLTAWVRRTGAEGARAAKVRYPDPERTIEGYMAHLGLEPSYEAFLAEVRRQRRGHWREEFTAQALNAWFRAGFGMGAD